MDDLVSARARMFAALELVLDLVHSARQVAPVDLESLVIFFCVSEASMRPLMLSESTPAEALSVDVPPEAYRGGISMALVADRLAMPRETVRRKIKGLIEKGYLQVDTTGRVRTFPGLTRAPETMAGADSVYDAVQRYLHRIEQLRARLL